MSSTKEDPQEDPLILVGELTSPFGILGQMKMRPLMDHPEALTRLPGITLRFEDGREETRRVSTLRRYGAYGGCIVTLSGVTDRSAAETMRGVLVLIRRSELPPLEEDSYYESQLIGLRVLTESGRDLGPIEAVHFYPANDVYETPLALIPAVGAIVVDVDVAAGIVRVRDIPGLRKDE